MADNCEDCNPLVNSTPTSIPLPVNTDCPEDIGCIDVLAASCISVTNVTDCITNGQNLQELINNIRAFICDNKNPNCKVGVTSDDTCCQYLYDAITSDSLDITVTGSGCLKLNIETQCFTWNNINPTCGGTGCYKNGWSNLAGSHQLGQYSNEKDCSIKLRGVARKDNNQNFPTFQSTIFVLPINSRPASIRVFPTTIYKTDYSAFTSGIIQVVPTGEVTVYSQLPVALQNGLIAVSLDPILFEPS